MPPIDTSRCVKCGLCSAECPTYRWRNHEAWSPRGRLALIQALVEGRCAPSHSLHRLLDACLLCRRCEALCPSEVPFGHLMDLGRQRLRSHRSLRQRMAVAVLSRPRLARPLLRLGKGVQKGLPWTLPSPASTKVPWGWHRAPEPKRGRVGLFVGCTGLLFDGEAVKAAILLLNGLGFDVWVPSGQVCCGALDAHGGNGRRAEALAARNRSVFRSMPAVVSLASGCGAHLSDYGGGFPHWDICRFLVENGATRRLKPKPLKGPVLVHTPCTLENVLGTSESVFELLGVIPEIELTELGRRGDCCGAGGLTFLSHSRMSRALRAPFREAMARHGGGCLITSNFGCGFHLVGDLKGWSHLHPVTLVARQLKDG